MDWALLGVTITKALLPLAIPLVGYVGHAIGTWLHAHAKSTATTTALNVLDSIVGTVVAEAEQTIVPALKSKLDSGKLTAQDAKDLKDQVVAMVLGLLKTKGIDAAVGALQLSEASLQQFVASKVEEQVYRLKNPDQAGLNTFTAGGATAPIAGSPAALNYKS